MHVRPFTSARSPEYEHSFVSLSQAAGAGDGGVSGSGGADGGIAAVTPGGETHRVLQSGSAGGPTPGELVEREGDAFQRCYEREALARDHTIEGTVTIRFTVRADGGVESVNTDVESNNADPTIMGAAARCMEQRVRGMRFGAGGQSGTEYRVPFRFVVGGAAADPGE